MNILEVYCSYTRGGAELQTFEIAKQLNKLQMFRVILACPRGSFLYQKAIAEKVLVKSLNILGSIDIVGIFHLWKIIIKEKIQIMHINQGKLFWPAAFIKLIFGKKLKVIFHRRTTIPLKKISYWTYKYADLIIADSIAAKNVILKSNIIKPEKIVVVYPGIDLEKFNLKISGERIRKKYNLVNCFVVGIISALNPPEGKGHKYLIKAIKQLVSKFPEIKLLIVGKGKLRPQLELLVKEFGIKENVIFTGYQENVEEYIAAMDILCLPTCDEESFGMVLIEAQAMNKPVIGTSVGGIPETFIPEKTGYLIPPRNSEQIVEVISKLISTPAELKAMSENCRKWVAGKFNIQLTVKNIEKLYRSIMKE